MVWDKQLRCEATVAWGRALKAEDEVSVAALFIPCFPVIETDGLPVHGAPGRRGGDASQTRREFTGISAVFFDKMFDAS